MKIKKGLFLIVILLLSFLVVELFRNDFFQTIGAWSLIPSNNDNVSKYTIKYNMNQATNNGSSHPSSGVYGKVVEVSNPVKKVKFTFDATGSGIKLDGNNKKITVTKELQFTGWTFNGDVNTAYYGDSIKNVGTKWNDKTMKIEDEYFLNLASRSSRVVTMTANWSGFLQLPNIKKKNFICTWNTKRDGSGVDFQPGSIYTGTNNTLSKFTFYAVCNAKEIYAKDYTWVHSSPLYTIGTNNYIYETSNNKKVYSKGILVTNHDQLGTAKSLKFSVAESDGEDYQHIYIRSKYPTDSGGTFPNNLPMNDVNKLKLRFNITIDSSYKDVRIKINYLTSNYASYSEINVLDYNSLRFYVSDAGESKNVSYGSFGIDDYSYMGTLKQTTSDNDDIYEDNWEIVSSNLFSNSSLKNKCRSKCNLLITIVPFDTYHASNSHFNFSDVSVVGYIKGNYQKDSYQTEKVNTSVVRSSIANRMFFNATIAYKPNNGFLLGGDDSVGKKNVANNVNDNKAFKVNSGFSYRGQPYGGTKTSSTEEFMSRIDNGVYDIKGSNKNVYSFSCSTSALDAIYKNLPLSTNLDWSGKAFYSSLVDIVECKNKSCKNIDRTSITSKTADEIRKLFVSGVDEDNEMYYRYANLKPGDLLVHKEVCTDEKLCGLSGHTRLVTDVPYVVYNDSKKTIIDPDNSYVYTTEITSVNVNQPLGSNYVSSFLSFAPNRTNFYNFNRLIQLQNYESSATQWRLSKKYKFKDLFWGEFNTDGNRLEQVFFPFTLKVLNNSSLEKPYAQYVYHGDKVTFYSSGGNALIQENIDYFNDIASDIHNKGKIVGTIKTNYKLTKVRFNITALNESNITESRQIDVYPVYSLNNIQSKLSMLYDDGMAEVNQFIKDKTITKLQITVLKLGPGTNEASTTLTKLTSSILGGTDVKVFDWTYATGVSLNKSSLTLKKHSSVSLQASVLPSNATNRNVIWSTSDDSMALVDDNGNVKIKNKEGKVDIIAKSVDGGFSKKCTITVT